MGAAEKGHGDKSKIVTAWTNYIFRIKRQLLKSASEAKGSLGLILELNFRSLQNVVI